MIEGCSYYNLNQGNVYYYNSDGDVILCKTIPWKETNYDDRIVNVINVDQMESCIDPFFRYKAKVYKIVLKITKKLGRAVLFYDKNNVRVGLYPYSGKEKLPFIIDHFSDRFDYEWISKNIHQVTYFNYCKLEKDDCIIL